MILAKEINADLCIIDDYLARKHAKNLGLTVTGTLGVLVKAKEKNILKEVKPVMDEMLEKKFYIDKKLYNEILEICGEK
jgi:predicted nucleic acid-binding protein